LPKIRELPGPIHLRIAATRAADQAGTDHRAQSFQGGSIDAPGFWRHLISSEDRLPFFRITREALVAELYDEKDTAVQRRRPPVRSRNSPAFELRELGRTAYEQIDDERPNDFRTGSLALR
jgi:hypothetical protein